MEFVNKLPPDEVNVSSRKPLRAFFSLLICAALLLGSLYLVLGFVVDFAAPYIPWSWEKAWGEQIITQIADDKRTPQEEELQVRLNRLATQQVKAGREFVVHIVDDSTVNAVALPGGHIVFFKGLLDLLDNPEQVDFVLAHELGHFEHRDHLRGLGRRMLLMAIFSFIMGESEPVDSLFSGSMGGMENKFSQVQEREADLYALKLLRCTHGNVDGAVESLAKLAAREDASELYYFFATHPHPKDRVAEAKSIAAYLLKQPCP